MILHIVAVRDRAIDAFGNPVFVPAIGAAIRSFQDEANNVGSAINMHPEDYDLYVLGEFDTASGRVVCLDSPRMVSVGKDVIKRSE